MTIVSCVSEWAIHLIVRKEMNFAVKSRKKDRVMMTITTTRSAENQTFQIRKQTNQIIWTISGRLTMNWRKLVEPTCVATSRSSNLSCPRSPTLAETPHWLCWRELETTSRYYYFVLSIFVWPSKVIHFVFLLVFILEFCLLLRHLAIAIRKQAS